MFGQLVALRLPAGTPLALTEDQRRTLLRRRVPGRELALRESGTVRFIAPAQPRPSSSGCLALAIPLDQGDYLDSAGATDTPCRSESPLPALRHDPRAGAPFAAAPMPAGTYLGRLTLREGRVVTPGTPMRLVSAAGPVVIERTVSTLQPARAGQRVFAAGADGTVVASRLLVEERQ